VWTAHAGHRTAFLIILLILLFSDWVDGRLASLLDQRSVLGARLDSVADWLLYAALGLSVWWLEEAVVRERIVWFAKAAWLVAGTGTVIWVMFGQAAAVPWVLAFVTLTNLEAVAIGFVLPQWQADVSSLRHALRLRRG
jgi:CDP-diacylglycerol--glycerol-3-phosphate 3-phosphatidyltransferase